MLKDVSNFMALQEPLFPGFLGLAARMLPLEWTGVCLVGFGGKEWKFPDMNAIIGG
jgi:hypothetical protein